MDARYCLFFVKLNHLIHACHRPLNTSLTCPRVRMVIHLISTSILTSLPYITNYDLTYLQHFAVIMHEYRAWVETSQYSARCTCMRGVSKSFQAQVRVGTRFIGVAYIFYIARRRLGAWPPLKMFDKIKQNGTFWCILNRHFQFILYYFWCL